MCYEVFCVVLVLYYCWEGDVDVVYCKDVEYDECY